ncbi:hypothetical protein [Streptomyces sp. NBC_00996]|uniref:hypothetical protein n=1 Tax=Streptomyces sp. NBC_00996 TaxID=2903710 RepID=UPI00386E4327|nr:hypothetical protein OG390_47720 [Streptomyces sp. NBC_00996]
MLDPANDEPDPADREVGGVNLYGGVAFDGESARGLGCQFRESLLHLRPSPLQARQQ